MQVKTLLSVVAQNFWLPSFSNLHNFYLNIPITISRKKKIPQEMKLSGKYCNLCIFQNLTTASDLVRLDFSHLYL